MRMLLPTIRLQVCASAYKFTGEERDAESGNDYMSARYFASSMGRFLSPDIVGGDLSNPQSLNRYTYVLNNPLFWTDPSGFQEQVRTGSSCGNVGTLDNPVIQCSSPPPAPSGGGNSSDSGVDSELPTSNPDEQAVAASLSGSGSVSAGQELGGGLVQGGLDMAGLIPGPIGMGANIASAGMSLYNGHYGAAALSLAFALPVVGQLGADAHAAFEAGEIG